jgi:hypothetical protein
MVKIGVLESVGLLLECFGSLLEPGGTNTCLSCCWYSGMCTQPPFLGVAITDRMIEGIRNIRHKLHEQFHSSRL